MAACNQVGARDNGITTVRGHGTGRRTGSGKNKARV